MSTQIICDGDGLDFLPVFGHRTITNVIGPKVIRGSGIATVKGKKICVLGDEKKVQIQAQYSVPGHSPGFGTLTIVSVAADQQTPRSKNMQPLLIMGLMFDARFTPTQPAMKPGTPPTPEPNTPTVGKGKFVPAQLFATAKG